MRDNNNPYLLLTPGPLSTSLSVRESMLKDWCTWDDEYKSLVQDLRSQLLEVNNLPSDKYTTVLMQGSGTFVNEAVIVSAIRKTDRLLVISNGIYGERLHEIATKAGIPSDLLDVGFYRQPNCQEIENALTSKQYTHAAIVHCETTTGILNPIESLIPCMKQHNVKVILDAMSSLGGIPIDIQGLDIDFTISSANKCIQGVPGFGYVIAKKKSLSECKNISPSLSLDIFDQWESMEKDPGKWRFTSPTHVVRAFYQALNELSEEGGIVARNKRYIENQALLVTKMEKIGFEPLIRREWQSPIITTFLSSEIPGFKFEEFYDFLKERSFVVYPGKVTDKQVFRIGNIGDVFPKDIDELTNAIKEYALELQGVTE
ncbi:MAG: 2-aminoethylphosphonate--pyruvate transaminase [Spirochaetales bacterium]|nr:2-aminoethylphosphonate--pyruvate transaminase [Spirochaetales bacterium]